MRANFCLWQPQSYLMWPKLNTMEHLLTLATLFTSLSAFAQLPYNPDANNDGLIGAFDLTSLLSVYSNTFSNGVLGEGVSMANLEMFDIPNIGTTYIFEILGQDANSIVIDLSLIPVDAFEMRLYALDVYNGLTLTILQPSNFNLVPFFPLGYSFETGTVDGNYELGYLFWDLNGGINNGRCFQLVYWNGEWLPMTNDLYYTADN